MAPSSPDQTLQFLRALARRGGGCLLSDDQLLERYVHDRDPLAFETLLHRHGPMVWGVCRRVLGEPTDADDAFQATFVLLVRKAGDIRRGAALGSWLHGTAYRVAVKGRARRTRRQTVEAAAPPAPPTDPWPDVVWRDVRRVLDEELNRLPEKYRTPLVLCYLEGLTSDAAARRLGWTVGTLWGRLARGRELLRRRLARRDLALSAAGLFTALTSGGAGAAVPQVLITATLMSNAANQSAGVAELVEGVVRQMILGKWKLAVGVLLAVGLLTLVGGWAVRPVAAVPIPRVKPKSQPQDEFPPFDGKLHVRGQKATPQGGKFVLYSRNRYGNYPLAGYAFHLGLRNDDARVGNAVNLLFGNRKRENAFLGQRIDCVPRPNGDGGSGGNGGAGGTRGNGENGGNANQTTANGAAGMNGENAGPGVDEFQVNCHGGPCNRIVDLGQVDYARATVPQQLRRLPDKRGNVPQEENIVPVRVGHVYVVHVYSDDPRRDQDFHVKFKVLKHRENDAVLIQWARLPAVRRAR
jgi:RNA polymerase sigma factor (sigma-70 family)